MASAELRKALENSNKLWRIAQDLALNLTEMDEDGDIMPILNRLDAVYDIFTDISNKLESIEQQNNEK